jgi:hypothetical protein
MFKKALGLVVAAAVAIATPVVSFAVVTAPTTATELAQSIDIADAKGGVLAAAGIMIGLAVIVMAVGVVISMAKKK